jgi:hypothetical protein
MRLGILPTRGSHWLMYLDGKNFYIESINLDWTLLEVSQ